MQVQKNDFVEIEFTGKANGNIFDTTNKEEAKQIGLEADVKPMIISVGNQMLIKGLDEALESKETGKKYSIHLTPEQAFGKRIPSLVKTMPIRIFHEQKLNPQAGMAFQLDNYLVKILSVSGGRVIADFNNPLAGKEIDYDFTITRKIEDEKEKINALQDYFFKERFEFEIKDKKIIFKNEKTKKNLEELKQKFKEITGFESEVEESSKLEEKIEKKEEKKEEKEEQKSKEKIENKKQ